MLKNHGPLRALLAAALTTLTALTAAPMAAGAADAAAMPTPKRKVIIDQDSFGPGGSNLQAVLMLLQAPDVEVLGITVVSGDGWAAENAAHVLRLLEIAQRPEVPVYKGAVQPLVNSEKKTLAWEQQHGKLYYKGAWTQVWPAQDAVRRSPYHADPEFVPESPAGQPALKLQTEPAASFMVRKVREFPGQVTVWAGGPLTNVALAARLDPTFASQARELVFMGGSFNPVAADNAFANEYLHTPRLEFNMRWDAEAASAVLHEPWRRITQVPIDPTTKTFFSAALLAEVGRGRAPFDAYLLKYGQSFPMWDELAAAVWLDPSLVTRSTRMPVDVDTSPGAGYGTTLSWPLDLGPGLGEQPVTVVQDVDVPRFERLTVKLLSQPRPR
jgi:inosine-uridine nucleoside N-ribohydrolase